MEADLYADVLQGAQIPLYCVGGCLSFIAKDLGGAGKSGWLPVSYTLAIASVAPFTGYLQDIFGRRYITIMGALCVMAGIIIVGPAHTFGPAAVGMAIAGVGAAVTELTSLAGYFYFSLPLLLTARKLKGFKYRRARASQPPRRVFGSG